MTTRELLEYELNGVGKQIEAAANGMSEAAMDTPCSPVGMTPRDMLEHLCEAYQAYITMMAGGKHEWGSFKIADPSAVVETFKTMRKQAVEAALSNDKAETIESAYNYIIAHDNYHVGQLALARIQSDPQWNPYSLYE